VSVNFRIDLVEALVDPRVECVDLLFERITAQLDPTVECVIATMLNGGKWRPPCRSSQRCLR
jgi:hypothetical protein